MLAEPRPLSSAPPKEVPLPNAPLARVLAQVRFPPILAIGSSERVAVFQEEVRNTYPILNPEHPHVIEIDPGEAPRVRQTIIWRMSDRENMPEWRISLGIDFVTLETSSYQSRKDFLRRLRSVISATEKSFRPASASRVGVRYIDRLTGEAVNRIGQLIQPSVLGVLQPSEGNSTTLGSAIHRHMTEALFFAKEGRILGRWGQIPPSSTYDPEVLEPIDKLSWVIDLDMFTDKSQRFATKDVMVTARSFSERLYSVFRQMVTPEFLEFYGGKP